MQLISLVYLSRNKSMRSHPDSTIPFRSMIRALNSSYIGCDCCWSEGSSAPTLESWESWSLWTPVWVGTGLCLRTSASFPSCYGLCRSYLTDHSGLVKSQHSQHYRVHSFPGMFYCTKNAVLLVFFFFLMGKNRCFFCVCECMCVWKE